MQFTILEKILAFSIIVTIIMTIIIPFIPDLFLFLV